MALSYETEKVFGHARTGGNSNNCPSHRTGADSLASGQASLFETGKIFGRVQTGEGDNNRPRRTLASMVKSGPIVSVPNSACCGRHGLGRESLPCV